MWNCLSKDAENFNLQIAAFLLMRLHSRRINETSSEVEDIIVTELTSPNKLTSGLAAKKFRDFWVFCRNAAANNLNSGIPLKQMNR